MNNLRLRLTTLHLAQRFRMDGDTFILYLLLVFLSVQMKPQSSNYTASFRFRPDEPSNASINPSG
jgi:hypothetical protein